MVNYSAKSVLTQYQIAAKYLAQYSYISPIDILRKIIYNGQKSILEVPTMKKYYLVNSFNRGIVIVHSEEERDRIIEKYKSINCYETSEELAIAELGCELAEAWTYTEDDVTWYYNHYLPEANYFFYMWEDEPDEWLLDYAGIC